MLPLIPAVVSLATVDTAVRRRDVLGVVGARTAPSSVTAGMEGSAVLWTAPASVPPDITELSVRQGVGQAPSEITVAGAVTVIARVSSATTSLGTV